MAVAIAAAAVLAVFATGSAFAWPTWSGQTDDTQLTGSHTYSWYSWIDENASAHIGDQLTWYNALEHRSQGTPATKPAVIYKSDLDGQGMTRTIDRDYNTVPYGGSWDVYEWTDPNTPVESYSTTNIQVSHGYYDSTGNTLWVQSSYKTQPFHVV